MRWLFRGLLLLVVLVGIAIFLLMQPTVESKTLPDTRYASPERLKTTVKLLSADFAKQDGQLSRLELTRDYIQERFVRNGFKTELQEYEVEGQAYTNVIAYIPGQKKCPLIVVGAHYDTYKNLPGADDNASGVAVLIELSGALANSRQVNFPLCPIQLVAYANEEPPFFKTEGMGSYVHAKSLKEKSLEVGLMLSLETLGFYSDKEGSQQYPSPLLKLMYPSKGNFITIVGDLSQIGLVRRVKSGMQSVIETDVYSINAPVSVPGIDFSDHRSYWEFGYPGVMVTDTAFNRNLNYHTEDDTYDKLDYERMADVTTGLVSLLLNWP